MTEKIIRNALKCMMCDTVIESLHVHDFKYCKCGNAFIDGGLSYFRRGAKDFSTIMDLSEVDTQE